MFGACMCGVACVFARACIWQDMFIQTHAHTLYISINPPTHLAGSLWAIPLSTHGHLAQSSHPPIPSTPAAPPTAIIERVPAAAVSHDRLTAPPHSHSIPSHHIHTQHTPSLASLPSTIPPSYPSTHLTVSVPHPTRSSPGTFRATNNNKLAFPPSSSALAPQAPSSETPSQDILPGQRPPTTTTTTRCASPEHLSLDTTP